MAHMFVSLTDAGAWSCWTAVAEHNSPRSN